MRGEERPGAAVSARALGEFGAQGVVDLRAGFYRSSHPMLIVDDRRRWVTANRSAAQLLEVAREEISWRSLDEFTSPDARERLEQQWATFLTSGSAEGWYQLMVPHRGPVSVEFSALAHVQPGRHLLLFIAHAGLSAEQARRAMAPENAWSPRRSDQAPPARLTKREREVMSLVAAGGQSGDMAEHLFLSPETIKTHIRNAMAKLGARTRAHAVAISLVTGQILWDMYAQFTPEGTAQSHVPDSG